MIDIWRILQGQAKSEKQTLKYKTLTFCDKLPPDTLIELTQNADQHGVRIPNSARSCVISFKDFIIKKDDKPFLKKLKKSFKRKRDRSKANSGLVGEALNTLIAENRGFPCYTLMGINFDKFKRTTYLVFKKLTMQSFEEILQQAPSPKNWQLSFNFMKESLQYGIFHVDAHFGNQFYDVHNKQGYWIDLDGAIPLHCSPAIAFALQCTKLNRKGKLLPLMEYKKLVIRFIQEQFQSQEAIEVFEEYHFKKLTAELRKKRLKIVSGSHEQTLNFL